MGVRGTGKGVLDFNFIEAEKTAGIRGTTGGEAGKLKGLGAGEAMYDEGGLR